MTGFYLADVVLDKIESTKHLNEYSQARIAAMASPEQVGLINQAQLRSLQSAVESAAKDGVPLGRMVDSGDWELKFSKRPEDPLPALVHALYKG